MKYMELFAGIGGFRAALDALGHECVGWVECDKFARQSYESIYPTAKEEWTANDITTVTDDDLRGLVQRVGRIDILAFGSPCQDVSVAGRRSGFIKDGELTRSGLFFEAIRFARIFKPKYLLMENVVGMLSSNGGRDFATVLALFHTVGMEFVEWDVLNATTFGIPQNRERVFIVGHLRGHGGRKVFPLEPTDREVAAELECVGMLDIKGQDAIRRVYAPTGSAPTLTTMAGGNREPKIIDDQGRRNKKLDAEGLAPTLTTNKGEGNKILTGTRIRKLTPLECWRLQGRTDEDFYKAKNAGVSDSQLYKQAGNSLVPQIVYEIVKHFEE